MRFPKHALAKATLLAAAAVGGVLAGCSQLEPAPQNTDVLARIPPEKKPSKTPATALRMYVAPVQIRLVGTETGKEGKRKPAEAGAKSEGAFRLVPAGDGRVTIAMRSGAAPSLSERTVRSLPLAKQGAPRAREDGAVLRYRRPLYREILFAPMQAPPGSELAPPAPPSAEAAPAPPAAGEAPAAPPPAASEPSAPEERVQWICPRCQNDVTDTDAKCAFCGLAFAPEEAPRPGAPKAPVLAQPPTAPPGSVPPPEVAPPAAEAPKPPEAPPAPLPERFVCYFCGTEVQPTEESCPHCQVALLPPPGYERKPGLEGVEIGEIAAREMQKTDATHVSFAPDPVQLQNDLVDLLKGYGAFAEVAPITKLDIQKDVEALVDYAVNTDFDLLLIPTVRKWEISYKGIALGKYALGMVLWLAAWVPSWWVAGDEFEAELTMEFQLIRVRAVKEMREPKNWTSTFTARASFDVDQFDRGWYPWGILAVPAFDWVWEKGWRNLEATIAPHALAEIKQRLLQESVYRVFVETPLPPVSTQKRLNVALLVGVSRAKGVPSLLFVDKDLAALAAALKEHAGFDKIVALETQPPDPRNLATTENIRNWLKGDLKRLATTDTVIIYFAGYGAAVKVPSAKWPDGYEKYLITADTDPNDIPGTALSLTELGNELIDAKVRSALVVLDCSFGSTAVDPAIGMPRTLPGVDRRIEDLSQLDNRFLAEMTVRGSGRRGVVFAASAMDEPAAESSYLGEGHGSLTHYFVEAMGGAADLQGGNKDGEVDLPEVSNYVAQMVRAFATQAGFNQTVQIFGDVATMPLVLKKKSGGAAAGGTEAAAPAAEEGK